MDGGGGNWLRTIDAFAETSSAAVHHRQVVLRGRFQSLVFHYRQACPRQVFVRVGRSVHPFSCLRHAAVEHPQVAVVARLEAVLAGLRYVVADDIAAAKGMFE